MRQGSDAITRKLMQKFRTAASITATASAEIRNKLSKGLDPKEHLIICGTPRGGTTWLAEIFLRSLRTTIVWEPLYPSKIKAATGGTLPWRIYVPENAQNVLIERYLEAIFAGTLLLSNRQPRYDSDAYPFSTERLVVKFCRANRLLPWMVNRFDLRPPIFLVRHPCAVVASMLRFGQWDNIDRATVFDFLEGPNGGFYDQYKPIIVGAESDEEILAVNWCLDTMIPLLHPHNDRRWITVSYERLVSEGHAEFKRVCDRLGLDLPLFSEASLRRASRTTREGSPILMGGDQLSGWKKHLKKDQISRILKIVEAFGLGHIFSDAEHPAYEYMHASGCVSISGQDRCPSAPDSQPQYTSDPRRGRLI